MGPGSALPREEGAMLCQTDVFLHEMEMPRHQSSIPSKPKCLWVHCPAPHPPGNRLKGSLGRQHTCLLFKVLHLNFAKLRIVFRYKKQDFCGKNHHLGTNGFSSCHT